MEKNIVKAVCIADSHFQRINGEHITLDRVQEIISNFPPDGDIFVFAGDLFHKGIPEDADELIRTLRTPIRTPDGKKIPKIIQIGNHDISPNEERFRSKLRYKKDIIFPDELDRPYTFKSKTGHSIAIVGSMGISSGYALPIKNGLTQKTIDEISERELALLNNQLQNGSSDVLIGVFHYPPILTVKDDPRIINSNLQSLIDQHNFDLIVHGHIHCANSIHKTPGGNRLVNVTATASLSTNNTDHRILTLQKP